jgi:hypothetical protein
MVRKKTNLLLPNGNIGNAIETINGKQKRYNERPDPTSP